MTMPHLMNCPHSGQGWCLDCVKNYHDDTSKQLDQIIIEFIQQFRRIKLRILKDFDK